VHAGFLELARMLVESALKPLMQLSQEHPRKGIVLVGHGKGAGVASIATILLCTEGCPFAKLMAAGKVKCYAFSPPPTFEPLWALPAWVHGCTYSFIHGMDLVPRTCAGTLAKLYLALEEVDELPISIERRLGYIRDEARLDSRLPDYAEMPTELQAAMGSLFSTGTIVTLFKDKEGTMRCEATAPHMTDRLLVAPELVHDHAVGNYVQAFDDLRSQWGATPGCVLC